MKDLLTKLDVATEAEQERLIVEAIDLAFTRGWITATVHSKAWRWARSGAYLSAAVVLVPEGWGIRKLWQAVKPKDWPWWGIQLWRPEPYKVMPPVLGAATSALAVTIAAMKAHEHKGTSHDYQQG